MSDTCPSCGYCKHCGRSNTPTTPAYPIYPTITYGTSTLATDSGSHGFLKFKVIQ